MTETILLFGLNAAWQIAALALLALGLAIVFGQLRILNMAHGEFVMLGAYAHILTGNLGLPPYMALPVCIVFVSLIALIIERLVIRHLYDRVFDSLLATWALSILMREAVEFIWGRSFRNVPLPTEGVLRIGDVGYPLYRIVLMIDLVPGLSSFKSQFCSPTGKTGGEDKPFQRGTIHRHSERHQAAFCVQELSNALRKALLIGLHGVETITLHVWAVPKS